MRGDFKDHCMKAWSFQGRRKDLILQLMGDTGQENALGKMMLGKITWQWYRQDGLEGKQTEAQRSVIGRGPKLISRQQEGKGERICNRLWVTEEMLQGEERMADRVRRCQRQEGGMELGDGSEHSDNEFCLAC